MPDLWGVVVCGFLLRVHGRGLDRVLLMAHKLALSGVMTGFVVLILYLESVVPTGRAGFLVLSSMLMAVLYTEHGLRWMLPAYFASGTLAFFLVADKPGLIPFLLLFGPYPAWKALAERLEKPVLVWLVKLAGFNLVLALGYTLFLSLLPTALLEHGWMLLAVLALEAGFVLYDWILTRLMREYERRIAPHLHRNR